MKFSERIGSLFGRKAAMPSRLYEAMLWGRGWEGYSRWDKQRLIEQAYERNPAFYAATNLIAQTVASLPIYVEARSSVSGKVQSQDHPMLSLMERDSTRAELIQRTVLYYLVTGEAYLQIIKQHDGHRPLGLVVVPSQHINPIYGDYKAPIQGYRYREYGDVSFTNDEIIYFYQPDLRQYWHGLSAGVPLGETIDLNNAGITWNKNIAVAGGMPPVIAKAQGITKEEANQLRDSWENQSGANRSHRLKIISENLTLEKLNDKPHDSEWSQALLQTMRMIFMSLGVSSELMNDAGNKTYSNYQEARKALYMEACIPLARKLYGTITRSLQTFYNDNPKICLDVDAIEAIQEDRGLAIQRLQQAVTAGLITPNEARQELGYATLDDPAADSLQLKP